jgi:predicted MFS family arabinose efflux permease
MYLGFSLGAALGGYSLLFVEPRQLGFIGAACEVAALVLLLVNQSFEARSHSTVVLDTRVRIPSCFSG